jgi:2-oxoglutarate ferredoxin oxidoreductase subunit beta
MKLANPELDVWVVTGDGDALSIGGNHTMHLLRRNLELPDPAVQQRDLRPDQGAVFADQPARHAIRRRAPLGSVDRPGSPAPSRSGSGARFVARGFDVSKELPERAQGRPCAQGRGLRRDLPELHRLQQGPLRRLRRGQGCRGQQLWLKDGEPMLFGSEKSGGVKGIALDTEKLTLKVVDVVDGDWQAAGVIVHNVTNRAIAHMLVEMPFGAFPMALGVLYDDPRPTFEEGVVAQNRKASEGKKADLQKLLSTGQTWVVGPQTEAADTGSAGSGHEL